MILFCPEEEKKITKKPPKQQLCLKCKLTLVGLCELSVVVSQEIHIPSCMKQTPQNRYQGLSLLFCKCFFSQRWLQIKLSHSFPEQAKIRKTRWHSRYSCSVCQHGNCIELDDMTPTPPVFTSTSMGITFESLHLHLKNLSFFNKLYHWINSTIQGPSIPVISFHVICIETM